ncbi:hypothetical protein [Candidatus Palauibacter sp.]|uniref:hypothetical protein n=1 Tax=Candidatus Palauibacter sp. TaxID=3101350 RepID=UPI003B022018
MSALRPTQNVEQISKADVLRCLADATRHTTKEAYDKGPNSFRILGEINPSVVESAARSAKLLLDVLRAGGPGRE